MHRVRVVKREDREAASKPLVVEHATTQLTPEMVVKSWITATRQRRQLEMKTFLLDFKGPQGDLCLD